MRHCYESKCKNVVELVETFEDADSYYIVQEFWPGGDLLKYVGKNGRLPLTEN